MDASQLLRLSSLGCASCFPEIFNGMLLNSIISISPAMTLKPISLPEGNHILTAFSTPSLNQQTKGI